MTSKQFCACETFGSTTTSSTRTLGPLGSTVPVETLTRTSALPFTGMSSGLAPLARATLGAGARRKRRV